MWLLLRFQTEDIVHCIFKGKRRVAVIFWFVSIFLKLHKYIKLQLRFPYQKEKVHCQSQQLIKRHFVITYRKSSMPKKGLYTSSFTCFLILVYSIQTFLIPLHDCILNPPLPPQLHIYCSMLHVGGWSRNGWGQKRRPKSGSRARMMEKSSIIERAPGCSRGEVGVGGYRCSNGDLPHEMYCFPECFSSYNCTIQPEISLQHMNSLTLFKNIKVIQYNYKLFVIL